MGTIYKWAGWQSQRPYELDRSRWIRTDNIRKFGPKTPDHPTVGKECPACNRQFEAGDYTTIIALGPGDDEEAQERARAGRPYNAVAVEVHWSCATGEVNRPFHLRLGEQL